MSHLTTQQKATLKAHILADGVLAPLTSGPGTDYGAIAAAMSAPAAPAFTVWNSSVSPEAWRKAITAGAIQLDNLTVGKRDTLLFVCGGTLDCRDAATRQTLDDLTGTQNTLKAALVAAEKRLALRVEKLLATGTGSDAVPAIATYEGALDIGHVAEIFNG